MAGVVASQRDSGRPGQGQWGNIGGGKREKLVDDKVTNVIDMEEKKKRACWSGFAGCIGGLWATRQMTTKDDRELYVKTTLRELVIYMIFLGVFCIITFAMTTYTMFYYTRVLSDLFLETPYVDTRNNLKGSTQVMDFWRFTQTVLLDGIYWEYWYHPSTKWTALENRNVLYENRLLGVPRIRQLRVRNDSCMVPATFRKDIFQCYAPYSENHEDKQPFGLKTSPTWTYQDAEETKSIGSWGRVGAYSGAGSYMDFKVTKNETKVQFDILRENLWINRGTRAVFIDFTVYNANINLFCVVKIIVEFPSTGGIIPSWSFRTVKLLRYVTSLDYFVMACELIFLLFVFYYIIEEALEIAVLKRSYFNSIWNILDLIVIGLSLLCITYNIYNYITIEPKLEKLLEDPDTFHNFEEMGYWQVQFNSIVAVCVFFAWFKLFKYISFNKTMIQLATTLSRCGKDVAGFAIMFFIVFFAFSQLGFLLFGTQVFDFHTFIDSVFTLLRTILGDFNFREIEGANRILGPIFFIFYVFFVFFILLNMFLAIINDTYSEVKTEIASQRNEYEVADYFLKGYNNMIGKLGKRDKITDIQSALKLADANSDGGYSFEEVRENLKKCDLSEQEVEMFFSKYDIDGDRFIDGYEIKRMMEDLDRQRYELEGGTKAKEKRPNSAITGRGSGPPVATAFTQTEFNIMRRRADRMEQGITSIDSNIDRVLYKLGDLDKNKNHKKDAMRGMQDKMNKWEDA